VRYWSKTADSLCTDGDPSELHQNGPAFRKVERQGYKVLKNSDKLSHFYTDKQKKDRIMSI